MFDKYSISVEIPGMETITGYAGAFIPLDRSHPYVLDGIEISWGRKSYFEAPRQRMCRLRLGIYSPSDFEKIYDKLMTTAVIINIGFRRGERGWPLFAGQIVALDVEFKPESTIQYVVNVQAVEQVPLPASPKEEAWTLMQSTIREKPSEDRELALGWQRLLTWGNQTTLGKDPEVKLPGLLTMRDIGNVNAPRGGAVSAFTTQENWRKSLENPAPGVYMQYTPGHLDWMGTHTNFDLLKNNGHSKRIFQKTHIKAPRKLTTTIQDLPLGIKWNIGEHGWYSIDGKFKFEPRSIGILRNRTINEYKTGMYLTHPTADEWLQFLTQKMGSFVSEMPEIQIDSDSAKYLFEHVESNLYESRYAQKEMALCPVGLRTWETEEKLSYAFGLYHAFKSVEILMLPIGGTLRFTSDGKKNKFKATHKLNVFSWAKR